MLNRILYSIIFISSVFYCSCGRNTGCEMNPSCNDGLNFGKVKLDTTSNTWFSNLTDQDTILMTNSNGFSSYSILSKGKYYSNSINISNRNQILKNSPCVNSQRCKDYCSPEIENLVLTDSSKSVVITYGRTKNLFESKYPFKPDSNLVFSNGDVLFFNYGNRISINTTIEIGQQISFKNSMNYMNKSFADIYIIKNKLNRETTSYLFCDSLLFNEGQGIIGFILSNGERWLLEKR